MPKALFMPPPIIFADENTISLISFGETNIGVCFFMFLSFAKTLESIIVGTPIAITSAPRVSLFNGTLGFPKPLPG